jgi:hypothetical protein
MTTNNVVRHTANGQSVGVRFWFSAYLSSLQSDSGPVIASIPLAVAQGAVAGRLNHCYAVPTRCFRECIVERSQREFPPPR